MDIPHIQPMTQAHWPEVVRIYESGMATKNATFETQAPDWEAWDKSHRPDGRWVACLDEQIVGWAALSQVSGRRVYAGVAELSIYIDAGFRGMGIGDRLMEVLVRESEALGIWTLQAGVFPENTGSLRLHEKHGFRVLGVKERIGKMDDTWRDVLQLERRSKVVGV